MTYKDRIKELSRRYGSNAAFADVLGISEGAVRTWYTGRSEPKIKQLINISEKCGVSIDWLLKGEGVDIESIGDYALIPQVVGLDPFSKPITEKHFSKRWLMHFLGDNFSTSNLVLLKSSMDHRQMFDDNHGFTYVQKGDILLLDTSRTNTDSGGMFLEKKENLPYMVRSFDHDSPLIPEKVGKIIGRIAWLGREL